MSVIPLLDYYRRSALREASGIEWEDVSYWIEGLVRDDPEFYEQIMELFGEPYLYGADTDGSIGHIDESEYRQIIVDMRTIKKQHHGGRSWQFGTYRGARILVSNEDGYQSILSNKRF